MDNQVLNSTVKKSVHVHLLVVIATLLLLSVETLYAQMNWTCMTNSADWGERYRHGSLTYDNKIWVIKGVRQIGVVYDDIWYSSNGSEWTMATDSASFPMRSSIGFVNYNGAMWAIGGNEGC